MVSRIGLLHPQQRWTETIPASSSLPRRSRHWTMIRRCGSALLGAPGDSLRRARISKQGCALRCSRDRCGARNPAQCRVAKGGRRLPADAQRDNLLLSRDTVLRGCPRRAACLCRAHFTGLAAALGRFASFPVDWFHFRQYSNPADQAKNIGQPGE